MAFKGVYAYCRRDVVSIAAGSILASSLPEAVHCSCWPEQAPPVRDRALPGGPSFYWKGLLVSSAGRKLGRSFAAKTPREAQALAFMEIAPLVKIEVSKF